MHAPLEVVLVAGRVLADSQIRKIDKKTYTADSEKTRHIYWTKPVSVGVLHKSLLGSYLIYILILSKENDILMKERGGAHY